MNNFIYLLLIFGSGPLCNGKSDSNRALNVHIALPDPFIHNMTSHRLQNHKEEY